MTAIPALGLENVQEITRILETVDPASAERVADEILAARRVFVHGSGRSLLMLEAVGMRLMHIGLDVHVAGAVTTPAIAAGDVLVAASARWGDQSARAVRIARDAGARVVAITAASDAVAGSPVDAVLVLPARSAVPTVQHAGSLFEQSVLVLGDALCRSIQQRRGMSAADLDARHATL